MTETVDIKKLTSLASDSVTKLKGLWTPLRRILAFSLADDLIFPQKNLSVSIDKGSLSIAYGSRFFSRITIKGVKEYFFEEGKYPQPIDLASSLALAANEFGAAGADLTLSIPKAWTIIRTAEFPSTVKENISDVVSYEMDRFIPFSTEDAFFDFRVLKDNGKKLSLVIMAAKTDMIIPYINALNQNGFNVSRITVNLSVMGTLCQYMYKSSDTIFLEIDEKGYEGALFINGSVITVFGDTFNIDEKTKIDRISADIRSTTDIAKTQGRSPQVVALLRDKSPALKELFKSQINMPVKIMGETDTGLRFSESRDQQAKSVQYSPAVGGVLESLLPKAEGPNLLRKGRHEKPKTQVALTIILMLAIIFMWVIYIIAPLSVEEKRLKEISRQIGSKKQEVKKVQAMKKEADTLSSEIAAINNFKKDSPMTLNILKELTSILPETAWLTKVRITETAVEIKGYADSATKLLPELETSKYFRKVEFASPTIRDARMNSDRFIIKMEIEDEQNFTNLPVGRQVKERN